MENVTIENLRQEENYYQVEMFNNPTEPSEISDPWTCIQCDGDMVRTSLEWLTCHRCDAKLVRIPRVEDLPLAWRATRRGPFTRLYFITNTPGLWRYVPHAHKAALNQRPEPGIVVAKVTWGCGQLQVMQARVFRRAGRQATNELAPAKSPRSAPPNRNGA